MLYLAYRDLSKKWTMPIRNWAIVISNFLLSLKKGLLLSYDTKLPFTQISLTTHEKYSILDITIIYTICCITLPYIDNNL